jgi:hypothetical protein
LLSTVSGPDPFRAAFLCAGSLVRSGIIVMNQLFSTKINP